MNRRRSADARQGQLPIGQPRRQPFGSVTGSGWSWPAARSLLT